MHIVITGASGFVGSALVGRLLASGVLRGRAIQQLTLVDLDFAAPLPAAAAISAPVSVRTLAGDIGDADWLASALGHQAIDVVFHLASLPGGTAEQHPRRARRVNLDATQTLLELGQAQVERGGRAPIFVFASSIAVLGRMPAQVTDDTPARPQMTYGAQKLIGEILVSDCSRRGWIDGRAVRIPGVLARPPAPTGQLSAFLSDIIRELAAGRPFVCPVSASATTWASSLPCLLDQLLHAATLVLDGSTASRAWTLPALRFSMYQLVDAIAEVHGTAAHGLVRYDPDEHIEALFGRFPPLRTDLADALGFTRDDGLQALVRQAFQH
ncbi:NAD-dependent epimerase/dehydratase family protein [Hydrogenophaga sp. OTU3427]|uniref:NAD-dependent epimerase/dehydratase family protein n=1 Tax=Hydrogenophaga sp. OTU3427 TaxID=3043856 RepID=UPI00313DF539